MLGLQLCHYLAKGLTIKEVAAHLNLKIEKVNERLIRLRRKYNCTTTYQLMALLAERGEIRVSSDVHLGREH